MCGGTYPSNPDSSNSFGLSPRVRGNHPASPAMPPAKGSIPACAGEPTRQIPTPATLSVYPRVCGGTGMSKPSVAIPTGLSPRVRGNPLYPANGRRGLRSIPACAGNLCWLPRAHNPPRSIPACAGEPPAADARCDSRGLSPRVRGNPGGGGLAHNARWSIPACAGEPTPTSSAASAPPVYPRVCGGTGQAAAPAGQPAGLSPRVRGNHNPLPPAPFSPRSIPACAGEPIGRVVSSPALRVYPRVCGEPRL